MKYMTKHYDIPQNQIRISRSNRSRKPQIPIIYRASKQKYTKIKNNYIRIINIWNSLSREVAEAPNINSSKNRLDEYRSDQDIVSNYKAKFKLNTNRKSGTALFTKIWKQWQLQKHL